MLKTDVQGLETEARYDPETQTFDLHSPTVGSTKWWPAALGRTATHAIVHARLLIPRDASRTKYDFLGVKPFFVQLRDLTTHHNLPGIDSGDIGPTMGVVAIEEGYCRFNHVKLPRIALLARYGHISPETQKWVPAPPRFAKRNYATMLGVRARFVAFSSEYLGKAATIAVRYCSVRRQFKKADGVTETQVLDYPQVAMRTLPWIATAYALKSAGNAMTKMHLEMEERVSAAGDDSSANLEKEVHSVGSSLKAVCTTFAVDGIEELRRVCGGHGYHMFSGFQDLYGNAMVNFTGEGENYMLIGQTAAILLKEYLSVTRGEAVTSPHYSFIKSPGQLLEMARAGFAISTNGDVSLEALVVAFEFRAAHLLVDTARAAEGHAQPFRGNAQWEGIQVGWAFGEMLILRSFVAEIRSLEKTSSASMADAMNFLCRLFAFNLMMKNMQDYLVVGFITPEKARIVQQELKKLLQKVRPLAVPLVDSFGFSDSELCSAIGRKDGQVYETLLEWARKDSYNQTPVLDGWAETYGKMMKDARHKFQANGKPSIETIPGIVQNAASSKL